MLDHQVGNSSGIKSLKILFWWFFFLLKINTKVWIFIHILFFLVKLLCCDIFYYNSKENISIEIGNFIDERGRWKRSEAIKVRTCKIIENTCKHTLEVIQSYTAGDIKVRDATVTSFFAVFFLNGGILTFVQSRRAQKCC